MNWFIASFGKALILVEVVGQLKNDIPSCQKQWTLSSSKKFQQSKDITEKATILIFEIDWAVKYHYLKE